MQLNPDDYEDARQSRDPRFDGRFYVGVLTTGIYCRPVCPVRVPRKENILLYPSAAAAAAAGFRPCLRCRPESSPGTPAWSGASWKVSRALQLIDGGFLDDGSVDELATQLGVGARQLHRLFQTHLGASPVEVAQTRRLHLAKKLIDETDMPLFDVCFAAGFGSVRRFNAVFSNTYARSPRELREKSRSKGSENGLSLRLAYRPPFDWRSTLTFLAYRAIPGVEYVGETHYARTISLDGKHGHFTVSCLPTGHELQLNVYFPHTRYLYQIIDRVRSLFDLRADSQQIEQCLSRDKLLGKVIKHNPGIRVPGCWDGFEVAVRAILGQQITVKAAATLVARLTERHGEAYSCNIPELTTIFPTASKLSRGNLDGLGIVGSRVSAIKHLARLVERDELPIDCRMDTAAFQEAICAIKGIGEWTAQYIAMRALSDPNAFPHSDLILRRAAASKAGQTLTPRQLLAKAEAWQPWRAYAVRLLWKHYQQTKQGK
ncbi:MAG: DNA-3-methyladenine glycosylase 2 family protein [Pseudohongiellaceae bacterium]